MLPIWTSYTLFKLGRNCPLCCVVPGSWLFVFGLKAKLNCGGLFKWTCSDFGLLGWSTMPGWYRACQIGKSEQQVRLQPFGCMKSSGYSFGCCIPVSSLQYQLIGKLLGGSNPIGEISDHLNKVGDTFWFFSGGK